MNSCDRIDPIFHLPTPLLFAHRGGAKEVQESTLLVFRHAMACHADVLEVDVQLTKDEEMVVWHGPNLNNVLLTNVSAANRSRSDIGEFPWCELEGSAFVADPGTSPQDLDTIPRDSER